MKKVLSLIADGLYSMADVYTRPRAYRRPSTDDFSRDRQRLVGDVRQFGVDMQNVIEKKLGEQQYRRTGR